MYEPYDTSGYAAYLEIRDPVLGWPSPAKFEKKGRDRSGKAGAKGTQEYDAKGARVSPALSRSGRTPVRFRVWGLVRLV